MKFTTSFKYHQLSKIHLSHLPSSSIIIVPGQQQQQKNLFPFLFPISFAHLIVNIYEDSWINSNKILFIIGSKTREFFTIFVYHFRIFQRFEILSKSTAHLFTSDFIAIWCKKNRMIKIDSNLFHFFSLT